MLPALLLMTACTHSGPHAGHDGHDHHRGHRFEDAEQWATHFENPERDAWQKPDEVIAALDLAPTDHVADIGAATGYFAVRLAAAVPQGQVWGIDIEPDMVRYLNERAEREGLTNLRAVLGAADDARIPEPVDLVLVVNTYHHIGERVAYFERLKSQLRPGGRVVIVDFLMGDLPVGPPDAMKLPPETVEEELAAAGFTRRARHAFLPHQYVLELAAP
jgi:SAM-dependent methyltransferase